MSGMSTDVYQMITYRGIQGLGAGIIMATAFTAVGDLFAPRERGKWTGIMTAVFGFSSVIGPTLGGYIVDHMAWHWVFWIFLPLGIVAFVMIMVLFPKTERKQSESIDYLGSLFLITTIVPLLLAFTWAGSKYAWSSFETLGLFGITLVSLVIFILVEWKAKSPIMPLHFFKNGVVTLSNIIGFLMNFGMMGALIYISFFVQGVLAISPTYAGFVTMPMSIGMVITSAIGGQLISKTGKYKRFALIGMPIMMIGMILMVFMNSVWMAVLAMIVFGLGLGLGMPVFSLTIQNAVPHKELGAVTASMQLFRNLGGTIGIAVMGTVLATSMKNNLTEAVKSGKGPDMTKLDPEMQKQFAAFANPQTLTNQPALEKLHQSLPEGVQQEFTKFVDMMRDALGSSLSTVFLAGTLILAVAVVITFFLKEIPLRTTNEAPSKAQPEPDLKKRATAELASSSK